MLPTAAPGRAHRIFGAPALLCLLLLAAASRADASGPPAPPLHARSALLMEAQTGTILYELNADAVIPPASLTKLMTLHIALQEIEGGRLDLDQDVVPGPHAWASALPPHSSLMFLGPDQRLSVRQLLEGLVVVSGNDAAVAVAELISGSVPAFVARMNSEAGLLGFRVMHFNDPAGLDPGSAITAREYAQFCRIFVALHPDALRTLLSLRTFTYPLPENLTGGNQAPSVTQSSTNLLLGHYQGADGLKTGFIDESGYHMAATALRDGMRLISIVLGVPASSGETTGERLRAEDSAALLDYGFGVFTLVSPAYPAPHEVRVWKGRIRTFLPVVIRPPLVVVRKDEAARIRTGLAQSTDVLAPVSAGRKLGEVTVSLDHTTIARFDLQAGVDVGRAGLLRRMIDSLVLFVRGILGHPAPT